MHILSSSAVKGQTDILHAAQRRINMTTLLMGIRLLRAQKKTQANNETAGVNMSKEADDHQVGDVGFVRSSVQ